MSATTIFTIIIVAIGTFILLRLLFKSRKPKTTVSWAVLLNEEPPKTEFEPAAEPEPDAQTVITVDPEADNEIPFTAELQWPTPILNIEKTEDEETKSLLEQFGLYDHKLELASYIYPPLELLDNYPSRINPDADQLTLNKIRIIDTLKSANIEIDSIKATVGPSMTIYEIVPALGARLAKIKSLENDIALALATQVRITGPIPGKGTIGIEVVHSKPELVSIRSVLATERYQNTTMDLAVALGKTMTGEVFMADLASMPHLLIAGATGQGKSISINAILLSLLFKKHPSEIKFVLIDINKLELTLFRKIERHFLAKLPDEADAVITDQGRVTETLSALSTETDLRFELLKDAQVRHIKEYNEKFVHRQISDPERHRYLSYIVIIIDEFADLLSTADKSAEQLIASIAQRGRPVGIHLIVATQRPSVNIITGSIKANFSSRLAFRLVSSVDSRTILDTGGAEQLRGSGDMLYSNGVEVTHLQGASVSTQEIERISDFIGNQRGYPSAMLLPELENHYNSVKGFDPDNFDPLFDEAARLIVMHQHGSPSLIQRKLKLGYNRSGRIIDQLEAAGIVGPFEGSKARDVLFGDEYSLEQHLEAIRKKIH